MSLNSPSFVKCILKMAAAFFYVSVSIVPVDLRTRPIARLVFNLNGQLCINYGGGSYYDLDLKEPRSDCS